MMGYKARQVCVKKSLMNEHIIEDQVMLSKEENMNKKNRCMDKVVGKQKNASFVFFLPLFLLNPPKPL